MSCALGVQRGPGSLAKWSEMSKRSTCVCAGSIRKEDDKALKVYWSLFLKEQAKETGLSLKGQRFSECTWASSTSVPWELVRHANSRAPPRPTESESLGWGPSGCG